MGVLRFLLATAVVATHSSSILGLHWMDGGLAVRAFFVISGFYMSLILHGKYDTRDRGLWLFYSNRALRIFPMYLTVLVSALILYAVVSLWQHYPIDRLEYWAQAVHLHLWRSLGLITLTQIFLVGSDVLALFQFDPAHGFLLMHTSASNFIPAWRFAFLPQTWSVGVELIFYALAPLIVRKPTWFLVTLFVISQGAVQLVLWPALGKENVYTYYLTPLQLGYFVIGILAHRFFYQQKLLAGVDFLPWLFIIALGTATLFGGKEWGNSGRLLYLYGLFPVIPFLFQLTKNSTVDRFIGELSYPIYLVHVPMKWICLGLMGRSHVQSVSGNLLIVPTILAALLLVYGIDYPIERIRQARLSRIPPPETFPTGGV